jgi:hypothetical protein
LHGHHAFGVVGHAYENLIFFPVLCFSHAHTHTHTHIYIYFKNDVKYLRCGMEVLKEGFYPNCGVFEELIVDEITRITVL